MTITDANKAVVEDFIQALFTRGDLTAVDRYLTDDFIADDPALPGVTPDAEGFRAAASMIRAAFPDWSSKVHVLVAEGDYVAEHFTATGTHHGEIMGVSPTGRKVSLPGINIFRLRDGQIVERWGRVDDMGLLRQLGAIPEPSHP